MDRLLHRHHPYVQHLSFTVQHLPRTSPPTRSKSSASLCPDGRFAARSPSAARHVAATAEGVRVRPTPRRRATATGALIATAALLAVGFQPAPQPPRPTAAPPRAQPRQGRPRRPAGAASPAQRAELIREQRHHGRHRQGTGPRRPGEARRPGRRKDRDGTTHTRYERTYADSRSSAATSWSPRPRRARPSRSPRRPGAALKVVDTSADVAPAAAEKQALGAAKAEGSKKTEADRAPRKVVWLAEGKPVLAYETVVGGLQHDGTPNELHVVTDAATGEKLFEWQAVENGTGNTQYSGQVTLGTTQSGSTYT